MNRKKILFRLLTFIFVIFSGILIKGNLVNAADGYHTEYHNEPHPITSREYIAPFTFWCSHGGTGTVYRYAYYYECGNEKILARTWSKYTCDHGSWGEFVEYNPQGNITAMNRMDTWIDSAMYTPIPCYGYTMANTYYVAYNANGGYGKMGTQKVSYDCHFQLLPNTFAYAGHTFSGWRNVGGMKFLDNQVVSNLTTVNQDTVTLYAEWTPNRYRVTFHGNGGQVSEDGKMVTYGLSYGQMPAAVREGYTFLGWYTAPAGGTRYVDESVVTTPGAHTLYAHWKANIYRITYDANGGKELSLENATAECGKQVDLNVTAKKEGYVFVGWNTNPHAKEGFATFYMPPQDTVLYAIYSIPVSDVKDVYLKVWQWDDAGNYRIYPLKRTGVTGKGYTYHLPETDVEQDFNGKSVSWALIAWDHAGNFRVLKETAPATIVKQYMQTVEHYYYEHLAQEWIKFDVTSEMKSQGEEYVPQYIIPPVGYRKDHIDEGYIVVGDTVSKAYYAPLAYTLYFDGNGGICQKKSKDIIYRDVYGELPTAEREGHSFRGWYTQPKDGKKVSSSDRYLTEGDSTLYAQWQANTYKVYYDYKTNGGTGAEIEMAEAEYGESLNLQVAAAKENFTHIGWNTDPDAKEGLDSLVMKDEDIVLYAIYRKDIQIAYVDKKEDETVVRKDMIHLFNKEEYAVVTLPEQNKWTGWEAQGWAISKEGDAAIDGTGGIAFSVSSNVTFYGRYEKLLTITYDTNGSPEELPPEQAKRSYNASGEFVNPIIILPKAPERINYSFISWKREGEKEYEPETQVIIEEDAIFTAKWDEFPKLEAYDRYFTLGQAKEGAITPEILLEKVRATDREDGILENGESVTVLDYRLEDFTAFTQDGGVSVTYEATDSVGNQVKKTVMIYIIDASVQEDDSKEYVRFIGEKFYRDDGNYISSEKGGLQEFSIWKQDAEYESVLNCALSNKKTKESITELQFLGKTYMIVRPGTGNWDHKVETWNFTWEQIAEGKRFLEENGLGRYRDKEGIRKFCEKFALCKEP